MKNVAPEGKNVYYRVNGTGRDTYIQHNNGGFFRPKDLFNPIDNGKFPRNQNSSPKRSNSPVSGKHIHYVLEGNGRDTYIFNDDGGLTKNGYFTRRDNGFISNLREYPSSPTEACFPQVPMKRRLAPLQRSFYVEIDRRQKDLCMRLSSPQRLSPQPFTQIADVLKSQQNQGNLMSSSIKNSARQPSPLILRYQTENSYKTDISSVKTSMLKTDADNFIANQIYQDTEHDK